MVALPIGPGQPAPPVRSFVPEIKIVAGDAYPPIVTLATIREINYVNGGSISWVLFSPLNWLDRSVRHRYWDDSHDEILQPIDAVGFGARRRTR